MEITNINTGLNAQKVDHHSDPSCCGGVLDYVCVSPSSPLYLPFSLCSWPTLVVSFQLHQPCLLGVIASPHLSFPPPPPRPPPHPVSEPILVSVMDYIWERLSCFSFVCQSTARKQGVPNFASRSGSRLLLGCSSWVEPGRHFPVTDACSQEA